MLSKFRKLYPQNLKVFCLQSTFLHFTLNKNQNKQGLISVFLKNFSKENKKNYENVEIKPFVEDQKPKITRLELDPIIPFHQKHKFTISFLSISALSFVLGTFSHFYLG